MITVTIISILLLTLIAWIFRQMTGVKICPFCIGVAGTWIWMLAAYYLGYQTDLTILAMLMGGSMVGISYTLDKYGEYSLLARTVFIVAGFEAIYSLINAEWTRFLISILIVISFAGKYFLKNRALSHRAADLKEKMKQCC